MSISLQLFTIVLMALLTFAMYQAFGPPRKTLLYTKPEKERWDVLIQKPLGSWFTITSIVGTLTSLATSYIFFIGSSHFFGVAIFACSITLLFSPLITNRFSHKLLEHDYYKKLLDSHEQTAGVIASVFWRPENQAAQRTATVAKWVSLVNISAVIWLDFAFFGTVVGGLLPQLSQASRVLILALCCFTVIYFTFRFGLRGIVLADSFQSPLIGIATLVLLAGFAILFVDNPPHFVGMLHPKLPLTEVLLFVFQLTFLNLFVNLVTESHWLRLWIFKKKEIDLQLKAMIWTAILWCLLAIVGLFAANLTKQTGMDAVLGFLTKLDLLSPVFVAAFWVGAMAALFASADVQIYSFLAVRQFDNTTGKLDNLLMARLRPLRTASLTAIAFSLLYLVVQWTKIGLDQLVFLIFPISLNIIPAFVRVYKEKSQSPRYILISVALYFACVVVSLWRPSAEYFWRLLPPLMPLAVSFVAWLKK